VIAGFDLSVENHAGDLLYNSLMSGYQGIARQTDAECEPVWIIRRTAFQCRPRLHKVYRKA